MSFAEHFGIYFTVQPRRNVMASQLDPVPNPKGAELANSGEFGYVWPVLCDWYIEYGNV
jgi:hypothetical protein